MSMTKKSVLASLAAAALILSACGTGGAGGDGATSGAASGASAGTDSQTTLTFAYWDENQKPAIDKHIEEFNKQYPNITVETTITPYAQYWTKLKTQAEGSNLPDVFWMNGPNIQLYATNGMLAPLDDLVDSGAVDLANYPQALIDLYSSEGVHYGFPKDFDTIGVFYNKELFDKAGVEYPKDDWTWDDFKNTALTISEKLKDEGVYGVATQLDGGQVGYYNTILQSGGFIIKDGKSGYAEQGSIEGLQIWADLIAAGASPNMKQMADTKPNVMFESGKAAMMWSGNWITTEIASKMPDVTKVDIAPMPANKQRATVIHGLSTVVAANSPNIDAAKAFITYLASKEAHMTEAELGTACPAFTGSQELYEQSQPQWNMKVFAEAAKDYSFPYPVSMNTAVWNEFENELLTQAFSGDRPVSEVAKELAEKMQAALDEE